MLWVDHSVASGEGTSRKASKPAAAQKGDLLILEVWLSLTGAAISVSGGWTAVGTRIEQLNGTKYSLQYFERVDDGSEAPTITWDDSKRWCGAYMVAHRGGEGKVGAMAGAASTTSTKTVRGPSVEVAKTGADLLLFGVNWDERTGTPPEGFTERYDGGGFYAASTAGVAAGSTGNKDVTLATAAYNIGALLAIFPGSPPTNTNLPAITGTNEVGQTLTCSQGEWSGSPSSYAYQWQLRTASGWTNLSGEAASAYLIEHYGRDVRCVVTATNSAGSTAAASAATEVSSRYRAKGGTSLLPHLKVGDTVVPEPQLLFASADLADYFVQTPNGAMEAVPDPAGSGETVFKSVVNVAGEENPRAQAAAPYPFAAIEGSELWIRTGFWLPDSFPSVVPGWCQFFQCYGPPFGGPAPVAIKIDNSILQWQRNGTYGFDRPWQAPTVEKEHWYDVLIRERFAADGFVEMWIDGQQITFFAPGTYNPNAEPEVTRLEMETIDESNNGGPNAVYLQNYRQAGSFEAVTVYHKPLQVHAA
jgi:hypothetical protein